MVQLATAKSAVVSHLLGLHKYNCRTQEGTKQQSEAIQLSMDKEKKKL